jgi:formylglycine-generating enzyme required for sulfatase activity
MTIVSLWLMAPAEASAPVGQYTISNGTVYDTRTKLTWQQNAPSTEYSWSEAKAYCAGTGASLPGTGWRVPTIKELQSIVDDTTWGPAIDKTAFPATAAGYYWSSSPRARTSSSVWVINFSQGDWVAYDVTLAYAFNVRCVR